MDTPRGLCTRRSRVSETRFTKVKPSLRNSSFNRLNSNFNASQNHSVLSDPHPLSRTPISRTPTHLLSRTPTHLLSRTPTHTLTFTLSPHAKSRTVSRSRSLPASPPSDCSLVQTHSLSQSAFAKSFDQATAVSKSLKSKEKGECFVPTVWLPRNMHEKLMNVWLFEVVFYFGFCIEFVIKLLNLLKKIET